MYRTITVLRPITGYNISLVLKTIRRQWSKWRDTGEGNPTTYYYLHFAIPSLIVIGIM